MDRYIIVEDVEKKRQRKGRKWKIATDCTKHKCTRRENTSVTNKKEKEIRQAAVQNGCSS